MFSQNNPPSKGQKKDLKGKIHTNGEKNKNGNMDIREEIKPKSFTWEKESFHRENSQTDLQIVMNLCSQHNNIIKMKRENQKYKKIRTKMQL